MRNNRNRILAGPKQLSQSRPDALPRLLPCNKKTRHVAMPG
jgi:hypothetical protein